MRYLGLDSREGSSPSVLHGAQGRDSRQRQPRNTSSEHRVRRPARFRGHLAPRGTGDVPTVIIISVIAPERSVQG